MYCMEICSEGYLAVRDGELRLAWRNTFSLPAPRSLYVNKGCWQKWKNLCSWRIEQKWVAMLQGPGGKSWHRIGERDSLIISVWNTVWLATQQGLRSSGRVWYIEGVGNIRSPEGEIGYIKSALVAAMAIERQSRKLWKDWPWACKVLGDSRNNWRDKGSEKLWSCTLQGKPVSAYWDVREMWVLTSTWPHSFPDRWRPMVFE